MNPLTFRENEHISNSLHEVYIRVFRQEVEDKIVGEDVEHSSTSPCIFQLNRSFNTYLFIQILVS